MLFLLKYHTEILRMKVGISQLSYVNQAEIEHIPTIAMECITPEEVKAVCNSLREDLDKIERDAYRSFEAFRKKSSVKKGRLT